MMIHKAVSKIQAKKCSLFVLLQHTVSIVKYNSLIYTNTLSTINFDLLTIVVTLGSFLTISLMEPNLYHSLDLTFCLILYSYFLSFFSFVCLFVLLGGGDF